MPLRSLGPRFNTVAERGEEPQAPIDPKGRRFTKMKTRTILARDDPDRIYSAKPKTSKQMRAEKRAGLV